MRPKKLKVNVPAPLKDGKIISVHALVDPMGAGDMTQDDEYADIQKQISLALNNSNVKLKGNVFPYDIGRCDMYVFDYGGMLPGCDDMIDSLFRELLKAIVDRGDTLFVIYSTFTGEMYKNFMRAERPELDGVGNVLFWTGTEADDKKLKEWFE